MSTRIDQSASPLALAFSRFRGPLGHVKRRLSTRATSPAWLLTFGTIAFVCLAALIYANTGTVSADGRFLWTGYEFSADDLIVIDRALHAKHIPFRIDDYGRIILDAEKLDEADEVVAKLSVGPRSLSEIRREALQSQPFDLPSTNDTRQANARDELLAAMIRPLQGIVSATVMVHRPKVRASLLSRSRASSGPSVFVYLETVGDREITPKTVQSIQDLIASAEPDVKHDAVTVMDRKGNRYLDANNPALGTLARNKVREDVIRAEILDQLADIKGVQVSVRLGASPLIPPPAKLPPLPPPKTSVLADETEPSTVAEEPFGTESPKVGVNQPLDLGPEPRALPLDAAQIPPAISSENPVETVPTRAQVWVRVPRSYYLNVTPSRDPSEQERLSLVSRTQKLIHTALNQVLPADQIGDVTISTIPDDEVAARPGPSPTPAEVRRISNWAIPAGIAAALAAAVTALGLRLVAGRRPLASVRPVVASTDSRRRYEIDEASEQGPGSGTGPGPSARVRDLIRANPEAAASVLQRWTGQGGTAG